LFRNQSHRSVGEVTVHVNDRQSPTRKHVLTDEIQQQGRFPGTGCTHYIYMSAACFGVDADEACVTTEKDTPDRNRVRFRARIKRCGWFKFSEF
jgi:hypothetical protein